MSDNKAKSIQSRIVALGLSQYDTSKGKTNTTGPPRAFRPKARASGDSAPVSTSPRSSTTNGSSTKPLPPPPRGNVKSSDSSKPTLPARRDLSSGHPATPKQEPPKVQQPQQTPGSQELPQNDNNYVITKGEDEMGEKTKNENRKTLPPPPTSTTPPKVPSRTQTLSKTQSMNVNKNNPNRTSPPSLPPKRQSSSPVIVLKKSNVKPPPPIPRSAKPKTPLNNGEAEKTTAAMTGNVEETDQKEVIEKEEPSKKGFFPFKPEDVKLGEKKIPEKILSASDQLLLEQFEKQYADLTPEQTKAAITFQKYARRYLAKKKFIKRKKNAAHRENCAKEILSTEEFYVKCLRVMGEVYLKPFKEVATQPNPFVTKEQISKIFSDIEVITNVNDHFLTDLEERLKNYSKTTIISDVFLNMAPFFKTYTRYCNNFDKSLEILKECKKVDEFKSRLQVMDKDDRTTKLGISSYLILPIQRIPRYRLLLQDYLKHTEEDHPDYKGIELALQKICDVADHLNATMKGIDATNFILKIQEQFTSEVSLLEPHRRFVKEGQLLDANGTKMYIHIFNDILVYSKKRDRSLDYKGQMSLCNTMLSNYIGETDTKFKITAPNGELILIASSAEEKMDWLMSLHNAIEQSKTVRKNKTLNVNLDSMADNSSSTLALAMSSSEQEESRLDDDYCVQVLKKGATLLKYCRATKPHFRNFALSQDETKLMWATPNKNKFEAQVPLCEVKKIIIGQKTALFQRYKNPDLEPFSFSLLYRDRTLDIVCTDRREFLTWVQGITYLLSKQDGTEVPAPSVATSTASSSQDADLVADLRKEKKKFKEQFERIGDAYTWGQGSRGGLGHNDQHDRSEPLVLKDFLYLDVDSMCTENSATAAVMTTGELFTFGSGQAGRLGHGDENDRLKPTFIKSLQGKKIVKVTMGSLHTMCKEENGVVYVFGGNEYGQLGLGEANVKKNFSTPTVVEALSQLKIADIECGLWHSAAITEEGQLMTWGRGEDGQLGHNDKKNISFPTVVNVLHDTKIIEVALGLWHSLALSETGKVYSWGNATYGQIGHGNTEPSLYPKEIQSLGNVKVVQISAGSAHSACIGSDGGIYMWGNGIYGQMGNSGKENCTVPTIVKTLENTPCKQISCGLNHVLALMNDGKVYAWGAGTYGRLGTNTENDQPTPQKIEFLSDKVVRLVVAGGSQSCAVCAHQWVPDKDVVACMNCKSKFTFFNRRHHCRYCGGLFCNTCTSKRITLLRFGFDGAVRVCDNCYQILKK